MEILAGKGLKTAGGAGWQLWRKTSVSCKKTSREDDRQWGVREVADLEVGECG